MKKRILAVLAALSLATCLLCAAAFPATAAERDYAHVETEENGGVTLSVSYDDPAAGQPMTLHVSASGGSGRYKYYMSAPTYADADGSRESVMDPARMPGYTDVRDAADYEFMPMASGTYQFQFQVMDMEDTGLYLRKTVSVAVSDPDHPSVSSLVAAAVSRCNAETDGSEYQKALWLHDWLLDQLEYDNSLTWSSAESALCRGTGTCQAYQAAYARLLTAAGIENEETRDTGDGHTWNAAKIEGAWCQIDCTWDDSSDTWYGFDQRHLYFGLSDELMAIAHGKWRDSDGSTYGVHETSLANNYFVRSGEARDWAEAYAPEIQRHLDAGETSFSVAATNASDPESVSGIINGIVADQLSGMEWESGNSKVELNVVSGPSDFDFDVKRSGAGAREYAPSEFASLHAADLPDGTYRIAPAKRGGASLDVANGSIANGAAAQIWAGNGTDAQVWRVSHDASGFVVLTSAKSGRALDCTDGSSARGTRLQLWETNGTDAQRWVAARRSDGTIVLVSALSGSVGVDDAGDVVRGRVADLTDGATADGTRVQLWDANGTVAQSWRESAASTQRERLDALAAENASALADGEYAIVSAKASRMVADVADGSTAGGANVRLWDSNATPAQRWRVTHDPAGYVTLTSAKSGLALDVADGSASAGANVRQWEPNGTWAQKWVAVPRGDGSLTLVSALSPSLALDLADGRTSAGTNVRLWDGNGTAAQAFSLVSASPSVAPCGREESLEGRWWTVSPASDGSLALDVANGSLANGADVRGWSANGTLAQAWSLEWEDGWYRLVSANSGSSLDMAAGDVVPGTNAQQWSEGDTANQLFSVSRNGDGTVCLVNRATGLALGMSGSSLVGQIPDASSAFQRFSLSEASADLAEGVYSVSPACGAGLSLDVADGSADDGANVRSWASNGSFAQRWYLGRAGDGSRYLECVGSSMRLAVSPDGNVCQRRADGSDASQLWRVSVARGGYALESVARPGMVLDVSGGSSASGANVQAHASNGTAAQRFRLAADGGSLPSGTYVVRSAADASVALDVADGSLADGVNVRAWASNGTGAQKWRVTALPDGTCSVANCQSGRALDVADGRANSGTNVQQWASNGTAAQRWRAVYRPGGWALVSALDPSLVLTLAGGASRGSNAVVDRDSGSSSQRFTFRATTYIPSDRQEMVWKAQGYYSSTNWLILVDNTNNKVGIFNGSRGNWNLVQFWTCTTGKASTPTVLGEYQVGSRGYSFGYGYTCYYWTQFYNNYLFHSVLYDENTFRIQDGRLGQNLSHGCVRLDINNAKWIYNNIPSRTKVVSYR